MWPLPPDVVEQGVVLAARSGPALAGDQVQLHQVADGTRDGRWADVKELRQLGGGKPSGVSAQQGAEDPRRHPRHSGLDQRRGEPLDELQDGIGVAP